MEKTLLKKLALAALVAPLAVGCDMFKDPGKGSSADNTSTSSQTRMSSDWEELPENTNPNLKYFGFFHPDGFINEPSMLEEIDSLGFSNFYILNSNVAGDALAERLAFIKSKGAKCTLGIPGSVFDIDTDTSYGLGKLHTLKPNYKDIFNEFVAPYMSYINDGTVYAFYSDEPAWNGIPESAFVELTKWLSEEYPNTGRMACFACAEVGIGASQYLDELPSTYFDYLTDISYDNYNDWNDTQRLGWLNQLKTKATKGQWIWATPRTFEDNPERTSRIVEHLKGFYTEAIQDPQYRGFSCFSWSNGFDGDWGYGAKSFVLEDSEYYSREIHEMMSDIGRTIIGKELVDWSQVPTVSLVAPREVYNIGETVPFPICGAVDANGEDLDISLTLTSPSGESVSTDDGEFVPTESGDYTFTVVAGEGENKKTKSCPISVRYENEISVFENDAYLNDAGGNGDSFWCWPRSISTEMAHSGKASLKVTPHKTDGTWPVIQFNRDGNNLWDISNSKGISLWIYNPSDEPLVKFGLIIHDEFDTSAKEYISTVDVPSKEWTEIKVDTNALAAVKPDLDLTKVKIGFGNCNGTYPNRTSFYIDDVKLIPGRVILTGKTPNGFESQDDLDILPAANGDDLWCWPRAISTEQAHTGSSSLKLSTHPSDGTWPGVDLGSFDLTEKGKVEIWVYLNSDEGYNDFGLVFNPGAGEYIVKGAVAGKEWSKISVSVDDIAAHINDLTNVKVRFGQTGGTYGNRAQLYIDDFKVVNKLTGYAPQGFESEADLAKLPAADGSDSWCWPRAISTEQAHTGASSLKVTPHPQDGTWAGVDFGSFDLTEVDIVELYFYFDSDNSYDSFGLVFNPGPATEYVSRFTVNPKEWTKVEIQVSSITTKILDLSYVEIRLGQTGGTYPDRSPFYIDDLAMKKNESPIVPPAESPYTHGFDTAEDVASLPAATDSDSWCWPRAFSTEKAQDGAGSLKVTPHPTDGTWQGVDLGTYDLTNIESIDIYVYFTGAESYNGLGFCINAQKVGQAEFKYTTVSNEWTKCSVQVSSLTGITDLEHVTVRFCQLNDPYTDRSAFYLDSFNLVEKGETPEPPAPVTNDFTNGFENAEDFAKLPVANDSDSWCWPRALSKEQAHDGEGSLKVTPHPTDGTWQGVELGTYDLRNVESVEIWVYFAGEADYNGLGFCFNPGMQGECTFKVNAVSKTWVKLSVATTSLAGINDLEHVQVRFSQQNDPYGDRSAFYLDSFNLVEKEETPEPPAPVTNDFTNGFENAEDFAKLPVANDSDSWCWPRALSKEQAHDGEGSLKVTPHPTDGSWQGVELGTYDLRNVESVEIWVYFAGEADYNGLGFCFNPGMQGECSFKVNAVSKTWVKLSVATTSLAGINDLEHVQVRFNQQNDPYTERSAFYLDSFNLVKKAETPTFTNGFESQTDMDALPTASGDDTYCWPRALSTEQAHDGEGSLKVTPHPTDGTWQGVDLGTFDLTNVKSVEIWVYYTGQEAYGGMGFCFNPGMQGECSFKVDATPNTWVKLSVDVSSLAGITDQEHVKIRFNNQMDKYEGAKRAAFYLDSFNLVAK